MRRSSSTFILCVMAIHAAQMNSPDGLPKDSWCGSSFGRPEQLKPDGEGFSIKYSNDGSRVRIRAEVARNPEFVEVSVEDQGIGIERKDLNHVFDKFAQIENSLSRQVGGSGLGLPIARQLMESHNGAIWCDSEINKGWL